MNRAQVNRSIQEYWVQCRRRMTFKSTRGRGKPSFTRHNGSRIDRLKDSGWRYPRSSQGNGPRMMKPSIGYRNQERVRYTIRAYGLRPEPIRTVKELELAWTEHKLPVVAHQVGGRRRMELLNHAKEHQIPLMLRR